MAEGARAFAKTHVSDSAAQHFRAALLDVQLRPCEASRGAPGVLGDGLVARVCEEVAMTRELIERFPGHDALWCCLRSLTRAWLLVSGSAHAQGCAVWTGGDGGGEAGAASLATELRQWRALLSSERPVGEGAGGVEGAAQRGVAEALRFARSRLLDRYLLGLYHSRA